MVKGGEDPLHRLSRTPTKAFTNQQWAVWKEAEKQRTTPPRTPHASKSTTPKKRTTPKRQSSPSNPKLAVKAVASEEAKKTLSAKKPAVNKQETEKKSIESTSSPPAVATTTTTPPVKAAESKTKETRPVKTEPPTVETQEKEPIESIPPPPAAPEAVEYIKIPDKVIAMALFDQLDENASGKLSLAELDKGVVTLFPDWNHKPAIMAAYKAADRSGNGFVERNEFGYFLRYIVYYNNLYSVFAGIDKDGDRRITRDEFMAAAAQLDLAERDPQQVFAEIDENGGGMILFDELVHWMAINKSTWGPLEFEEMQHKLDEPPVVEKVMTKKTATPTKPEPIPEAVKQISIPGKEKAMELFDRLDENASGKLSLAELDKGAVTLFPDWNNKPAIMAAYKAADRSGNGFVERNEFGYFLRYIVYYNNLYSVFAGIDNDGDRRITRDEFMAAAAQLDLAERDPQQVFAEIDENGGGMILFDELVHWMATNKSTWGPLEFEKMQHKLNEPPVAEEVTTKKAATPTKPEPIPEAVKQISIPGKEKAMELFDRLDENASGKLSLAELDKGAVTLFPDWNNKPVIMAAYKAADRSDNGFVERNEFGYFLRYIVYYNNLYALFAGLDKDGDHRISREEFADAAAKLALPRVAEDIFAEIDTNGGGMILFDEFVHWMATNEPTWGASEQNDIKEVQKQLEAMASS